MRYLVALSAVAMPLIAWLSNTGVFGPTNGEISDRYPTLVVAAGYAFAIWGPIFALDLLYGIRQLFHRCDARLAGIRPWTAVAFFLTSLWMIVFSLQWFWLALAIIWLSLACLLFSAWQTADTSRHARAAWWQWVPLSMHAGWVSLAVFLNVAQAVVAFDLLPLDNMLPWSLVLFALAAVLLLVAVKGMRGNPWFALPAIWGLIGVFFKQRGWNLDGASVAAWVALALAFALGGLSAIERLRMAAQDRMMRAMASQSAKPTQ